ncbi:nucleotidyltransferase family protein [Magnetospirillum fulvum]|uniref:CBS domain-containing protein n=1 Tax=Magnetospirillum fulvum TaxID=1082 RepID=A0A1H6IVG7_MAGFU|nr:nucleotidyltransferase family protein [Magnetospirillum fulvum]SEH53624.1 CBS domain-containing protein [Magnetospirillum fulvum]
MTVPETQDTHRAFLPPDATVRDAIRNFEVSGFQIVLVTTVEGILIGTVTDGDVRRGLLRGAQLDTPLDEVMNRSPRTVAPNTDRITLLRRMNELQIRQMPIVDAEGHVVDLAVLERLMQVEHQDNWVVLMAGGLGTRLRPLTETVPKPMIPVGGRPLLEHILVNFAAQGFSRFFLSVNYKADMVSGHFGDGTRFDVQIDYLHETERKGTAGSLSLLPERPSKPLIVTNGDLLTAVDLRSLLDFHATHGGMATVCVRDYSFQIPFGVVETEAHRLLGITEKPVHHQFVNAGIYVLAPEALDHIPSGRMFDMTDLLQSLLDQGEPVSVFPVHEYWLDIGQMTDLERARQDYESIFPQSEGLAR